RRRLMQLFRIAILVLLLAFASPHVFAQEKAGTKNAKAIRFGKLWDAKGKVWTNVIVVVVGGKIRTVTTDASAIPAAAEIRSEEREGYPLRQIVGCQRQGLD